MTAVDQAAAETMRHLSVLRDQVNNSGEPCRYCRHGSAGPFSWNEKCRNPLVRRGTHDVVTGAVHWEDKPQVLVRRGLCGPDGKLFEPIALSLRVWRWARWKEWPLVIAVVSSPAWVVGVVLLCVAERRL